jgi:hypothetical protein
MPTRQQDFIFWSVKLFWLSKPTKAKQDNIHFLLQEKKNGKEKERIMYILSYPAHDFCAHRHQ